jgi:hypothetical protein
MPAAPFSYRSKTRVPFLRVLVQSLYSGRLALDCRFRNTALLALERFLQRLSEPEPADDWLIKRSTVLGNIH